MNFSELETALNRVEVTFNETVKRLEPLAQSLAKPPSLFLTRLLLGFMTLGTATTDDKTVCAGRALEFLDQALALGDSVCSESGYDENKLLVTDYFYGQAIDQVIGTGEAQVIDILSTAITGSAEDKIEKNGRDFRSRLIIAALDIAVCLGKLDQSAKAVISAARTTVIAGDADWPAIFPPGKTKDFIHISVASEAHI